MSSMSSQDVLQMPALGRHFFLGTLYDCRNDKIIDGVTFWDDKVLDKKRVKPLINFKSVIETDDSLTSKAKLLDINAGLKLSLFSGLIDIKGSGNYLNDRKTSKHQERVTLSCTCTVRAETMTMDDHLGEGKIKYQEVFDKNLATHVVTGVVFGGQAFFVFDSEKSKDETDQKIGGHLKAIIKKFPSVNISGTGDLKMNDGEKEVINKFNCTYIGDYIPEENPACFEDAMKLYKELSKVFKNDTEHAKPVQVTLHPIALLDKRPYKIVRDISVNLISDVEKVLEQLHDFEVQCNDLMEYDVVENFQEYHSKIKMFQSYIVDFKLGFQKKLCKILPEIRGSGKEEDEGRLVDLLKSRESSPFSQHALERWLKNMTYDVKILSKYTRMLSDAKIASEPGAFYAIYMDPKVRHVLAFSLQVPVSDHHLKAMCKYRDNESMEASYDPVKYIPLEKEVGPRLMEKARIFRDFVRANKDKSNTTFAVKINPCSSLVYDVKMEYYCDGHLVNENYEIPTCPNILPISEESTHNCIKVKWSLPSHLMTYVTKYKLSCCKVGQDSSLVTFDVSHTSSSYIINDLEPGCNYEICIQSICDLGMSDKAIITATTRPTSPPDDLLALPVSSDQIELKWSTPRFIGSQCKIEKYVIKKQQGESLWTETNSVTGDCRISVIVSPSDIYRFKVYCVCGRAEISLDSEVSNDVKMYPKEILKAKLQIGAELLRQEYPCVIKPKLANVSHDSDQKLEFGCKKNDVLNKVVIVVGMKGSGKSTFINGMCNQVFPIYWDDNFRLKIISEPERKDPLESLTKVVTSYTLHFEEGSRIPFTLTVIDTPGFDEGKITQSDKKVMSQIHNFLKAGGIGDINYLHAIYLVIPSSLPVQFKKSGFDKILSLFGEEMAENIHVVVASSGEIQPKVLEDLKGAKVCYQNVFKVNNAGLYACKNPQPDMRQSDTSYEYGDSDSSKWSISEKTYGVLFKELYEAKPKPIGPTQDVLCELNHFHQCVSNIWSAINNGSTKFSELMKIVKEALSEPGERVIESIMETPVSRKVGLSSGERVYNCTKCKFTCIQFICKTDEANPLKTEYCRFCPGQCHKNNHECSSYKYETNWGKADKVDNGQAPKRYRSGLFERRVKAAENKFRINQDNIRRNLHDAEISHKRLNEISLRGVPFPELQQIKSSIAYSDEAYKAYCLLVEAQNICNPEY